MGKAYEIQILVSVNSFLANTVFMYCLWLPLGYCWQSEKLQTLWLAKPKILCGPLQKVS